MGLTLEQIEENAASGKEYFLAVGKPVFDTKVNEEYIIKELNVNGIVLDHISFLKNEKKPDLPISYGELIKVFEIGRFDIEGFARNEVDLLKRAIRDVLRDLEKKAKEQEAENLRLKAEELRNESQATKKQLEEAHLETERIKAEKEKALAEKDILIRKKKTKKTVSAICEEERVRMHIEKQEADKNELRRLQLKQAASKAKMQEQRIRLMRMGLT
jgi:hypothetical protein